MKNVVLAWLLFFVGLFGVVSVVAATFSHITLTWDIPTERVNGAPLPPEEIKSYKIYYTLNGVEYDPIEIDHPEISYSLPIQGPGLYEFQISTVAVVGHNNGSLVYAEGPKSNVLTLELESFYALPGAPVLNTVTHVDCDNCGLRVVQ